MKKQNIFLKRLISRLLLISVILFTLVSSVIIPNSAIIAQVGEEKVEYILPTLNSNRDYYQSTFPSGLIYSSAWAGTFAYMPNDMQQVLFDDNYSEDWGICIFSLPKGSKPPSGEQGGTTLKSVSIEDVDTLLNSYELTSLVKPWDAEIIEVMSPDHKFIGAWAGEKLAQKWESTGQKSPVFDKELNTYVSLTQEYQIVDGKYDLVDTKTVLSPKQIDYIESTKDIVSAVDLERFDPDRYFVMGQTFWTDGTTDCSIDGRIIADTAFTVGGAGNFTVSMANGTSGTITGTNVAGSPVALSAGSNTVTTSGAVADGAFDITIGTAANWNTVNSWSATSGGACGASVPTNADNTFFDANSFTAVSQMLTVDAVSYCLSMTWTGATDSPTFHLTKSLEHSGDVTFIAAMAVTNADTGALRPAGPAAKVVTFNGVPFSCPIITTSNTGQVTYNDNFANGGYIQISGNGETVIFNNVTGSFASISGIVISGSGAKTVQFGTSILTAASFNYSGSNLTVSANTATINISGTGACALGNANWNGASFNLTGTAHTVSGNPTGIAIFTRTGTATKTDSVTFTSGTTLTCTTFAMIGNSAVNVLNVITSTGGSPVTITATNWTGTNYCDLMDITATNAVDLSGASVGNGGGNTNITFPVAANQSSTKAGLASDPTMWTSRIPLVGIDDVTVSHNLTWDMPRMGKSVTFTGAPTVSLSTNVSHYGSLTLALGMTYTAGVNQDIFRGRGDYTLNTNSVSLYYVIIRAPGGKLTLGNNLNLSYYLTLLNGTFETSTYNLTASYLDIPGTATRTINLGSGTHTINSSTVGTKWVTTDITNLTFNAGTSTIILTNSTANAQTFAGGGLTYNNVQVTGAGAYTLTVTGNNTFNNFKVDDSVANKTIVATGTTQTINDFTKDNGGTGVTTITNGTWTKHGRLVDGTGTFTGSPVYFNDLVETIDCTVAGTATITLPHGVTGTAESGTMTVDGSPVALVAGINTITTSGAIGNITVTTTSVDSVPIALDYMSVSGSTAQPANVWYAGSNGTDGGGNTQWIFDDPALSVTSAACTGVTMDKDGVTGGTFNGTIDTLLDGTPTITTYFEYGLTNAYGSQTADVIVYDDGVFTGTIPTILTPGETYHFRAVATNGNAASPFNGADDTFTFTMPTFTTNAADVTGSHTLTLNGNTSNMGVASDTYLWFEWGLTNAYGSQTDVQVVGAIGDVDDNIFGLLQGTTYHYRMVIMNGAVRSYGSDITAIPTPYTGGNQLATIVLPLIFVVILFLGMLKLLVRSNEISDSRMIVLIFIVVMLLVGLVLLATTQGILNVL